MWEQGHRALHGVGAVTGYVWNVLVGNKASAVPMLMV